MFVELKEGTRVFSANGEEVGRVSRFILDPASNEVTHVVLDKGWGLTEDKIIPFSMISSATDDKVQLNENVTDFNQLPAFEETHHVRPVDDDLMQNGVSRYGDINTYYWYPPYGMGGQSMYGLAFADWVTPDSATSEVTPDSTISIREGTDVMSADDKHVGDVERLFVDPDTHRTTHFLISQGLLFKDHKLVPTYWVTSMDDDKIQLSVSSKLLENLPSYEEN